jgi:hypothetical protein
VESAHQPGNKFIPIYFHAWYVFPFSWYNSFETGVPPVNLPSTHQSDAFLCDFLGSFGSIPSCSSISPVMASRTAQGVSHLKGAIH